jgi:cell wall-associated NlpC family hydrolase
MSTSFNRREVLASLAATVAAPFLPRALFGQSAERTRYVSPYGLEFTYAPVELIGDLLHGERGDPRRQSSTPQEHWYSEKVRRHYGAWGPGQRRYVSLPSLQERPLPWKCERVIAAAARFVGYEYQHHHVPDWNPPKSWPWKKCCAGHNGRGVDCSNFTTFVYNQGFGIYMNSDVVHQSEVATALEGRHEHVAVRRIELPGDFDARQEALQTGDLLYIRGREDGPITHVILWVGTIGRSPSGVPLVLDSHGGDVRDDEDRAIPCGIHLRPFRSDSWYNRCLSHAHRIFT